MKKALVLGSAILSVILFFSGTKSFAGDLEDLSGKWSVRKTNDLGNAFTQMVEFKKDKFTFQIKSAEGEVVLYAKGEIKLEKAGSLKIIKFTNIEGGRDADDLTAVDDDRECVYLLSSDKFTIATNFDKDRDKGPALDTYSKGS